MSSDSFNSSTSNNLINKISLFIRSKGTNSSSFFGWLNRSGHFQTQDLTLYLFSTELTTSYSSSDFSIGILTSMSVQEINQFSFLLRSPRGFLYFVSFLYFKTFFTQFRANRASCNVFASFSSQFSSEAAPGLWIYFWYVSIKISFVFMQLIHLLIVLRFM